MKSKEYHAISKMIEYIIKAEKYTKNITFKEFSNNEMIVDATVFAISQIGELVKNIDRDFQKEYPNIKWYILKGLRNRIVHDYEGINLELIWAIVQKDIVKLREELQDILKSNWIEDNQKAYGLSIVILGGII